MEEVVVGGGAFIPVVVDNSFHSELIHDACDGSPGEGSCGS